MKEKRKCLVRRKTQCFRQHGEENYFWDGVRHHCRVCQNMRTKKARETGATQKWWMEYKRKKRVAVFEEYGKSCECCGESQREFLSIDHSRNDGAAHRRQRKTPLYDWLVRRGFPKDLGLRTLCMNCNFARGKHGYCPHEAIRGLVEGQAE